MSSPIRLKHIHLSEEGGDRGAVQDSPNEMDDLSVEHGHGHGRKDSDPGFDPQSPVPLSDSQKRLVSSVGFYSDAYDLFVINMVLVIITFLYSLTPKDQAFITSMALAGAVAGQLVFGFLGDLLGRTTAWITTISLIIVSAIGSGLCFGTTAKSVVTCVGIWRLILGFGIGKIFGVYGFEFSQRV
jgi:hypothetical protein